MLPRFGKVIEGIVNNFRHGLLGAVLRDILAQDRAGPGNRLHEEDAALLCQADLPDILDDIRHRRFEIRRASKLDRGLQNRGRQFARDIGKPGTVGNRVDLHRIGAEAQVPLVRHQREKGHIKPDVKAVRMRIGMQAAFFNGRTIAVVLKIEIPCHIFRVQAVRCKPGGQHLHVTHGVLYGIDIRPVAGDDPQVTVSAVFQFFHRDHTGHGPHAVNHFLKVHRLSPDHLSLSVPPRVLTAPATDMSISSLLLL